VAILDSHLRQATPVGQCLPHSPARSSGWLHPPPTHRRFSQRRHRLTAGQHDHGVEPDHRASGSQCSCRMPTTPRRISASRRPAGPAHRGHPTPRDVRSAGCSQPRCRGQQRPGSTHRGAECVQGRVRPVGTFSNNAASRFPGGQRSDPAAIPQRVCQARRHKRRLRQPSDNIRFSCGPPPKAENPGLELLSQISRTHAPRQPVCCKRVLCL
jgi:hypothetical protein